MERSVSLFKLGLFARLKATPKGSGFKSFSPSYEVAGAMTFREPGIARAGRPRRELIASCFTFCCSNRIAKRPKSAFCGLS